MENDPVRADRGAYDRGVRHGRRERATSTSEASTRGRRSASHEAIEEARAAALLGPTSCTGGLRLRHRAASRRRGLHLRGGDRAVQLDRGQARRAAQQAAVPRDPRRVRKPDGDQQRRDAAQRAADPRARGRRVRRDSAPRARRARGCSACPVTSSAPACTRRSTASRSPRRSSMAGGSRDGAPIKAILLGGAAGGFLGPDRLDVRLTFEDARAGGYTLGSGVIMVFDASVDLVDLCLRIARVLPRRVLRPVRAVPRRHGSPGGGAASTRRRPHHRDGGRRARLLEDVAAVMRDASICGLGQTAASAVQSAIGAFGLFGSGEGRVSAVPLGMPRTLIDVEIDGQHRSGARGRDDPRRLPSRGSRHPDDVLRREPHADQRVPGVRRRGRGVAGPRARLLAAAEAEMKVKTDTERVRHSRTLVLEFLALLGRHVARGPRLASMAWTSTPPIPSGSAPGWSRWRRGSATRGTPGHHHEPRPGGRRDGGATGEGRQRALRARLRACVLCYKCVEACGDDAQYTFAIAVAGRGFDAQDLHGVRRAAGSDSACVYCGNCIGVCPTGALMFTSEHEMRAEGTWDEDAQTVTNTICPYCGVGCSSRSTSRTTRS